MEQLRKQKENIINNIAKEKKDKENRSIEKISPKDMTLIRKLNKLARWWRTKGPFIDKTIKVTIKANVLWTEDREPYIDGYDIFYNDKPFDFDDLIRNGLFDKNLLKYRKQINSICDDADKLEKKYPDADIDGMIFT